MPTAFAVRALVEATQTLDTPGEEGTVSERRLAIPDGRDAPPAASSSNDLNRSDETDEEVCFSYTPLDRTRVFNASLLAGEALAAAGA